MIIDPDNLKLIEAMAKSQHLVSRYDEVSFIPTGSLSLDLCIGGGWARGRNNLLSGQPNYGKSIICQMSCISAINSGLMVCVIDTENNWELGYCQRSGMGSPYKIIDGKILEAGNYFYFNNKNESVGNIIRTMCAIGCDLIVIDGAATIYSTAQQESDDFTYDPMMGRAKLLGRIVNLTSDDIMLKNTCLLWTNQWRETKDYGITRPGGFIFKHAHSVAVDLYSPDMFFTEAAEGSKKDNLKPESMKIIGRTWKNKVAPNFREFKTHVKTSPRLLVNKAEELIDVGRELGIVVDKEGKQGAHNSTFFFDGEQIAVSVKSCIMALMEKPEMADEIEKRIRVAIEVRRQTQE